MLTNEVRYVYDGMLVVQERDANNLALVSYTRGNDLSGSLQGAGGIGGLLARTDHSTIIAQPSTAHAYYHADGNGNVTAMVDTNGNIVAKYNYDPYAYDASWNLQRRTNNALVQTFGVNNLNELTNATRSGTLTVAGVAIRFLKKVAGMRQIEIAELMVGAGNYTAGYAEALYLGTPKAQLANPEKPKTKEGLSPKDIARMEQEMEALEHDFKAIDESYGENVLNLTVVRGYTKKLIENTRVAKFLRGNYPDLFSEFESIAAAETL